MAMAGSVSHRKMLHAIKCVRAGVTYKQYVSFTKEWAVISENEYKEIAARIDREKHTTYIPMQSRSIN